MNILQLSDLHILASAEAMVNGVQPIKCLQSGWSDIKLRFNINTINLIVLSGDLSQDNSSASYQHIVDLMHDYPGELIYLPGNHDDYLLMQQIFSQAGRPAKRLFADQDWLLIGLNSQLPGKQYGHIDAVELAWLETCLAKYSNRKVIIFLHHQLLKINSYWLDRIRLKNFKKLLNVIDAHANIQAVINGHVHQVNTQWRRGVNYMSSPSTSYQFMPNSQCYKIDNRPPGYRFLQCTDRLNSEVYYLQTK